MQKDKDYITFVEGKYTGAKPLHKDKPLMLSWLKEHPEIDFIRGIVWHTETEEPIYADIDNPCAARYGRNREAKG